MSQSIGRVNKSRCKSLYERLIFKLKGFKEYDEYHI